MIIRHIKSFDRFLEIVESMPKPQARKSIVSSGGEMFVSIEAANKDGICLYRYLMPHSFNDISESKMLKLPKETEIVSGWENIE